MTWHADGAALAAYSRGAVTPTVTASIEAHLLACDRCRAAFAEQAAQAPHDSMSQLDEVWAGIVDALDAPPESVVERMLRRVGVTAHTARVLAATPALRLSWFASLTVALIGVVALANTDEAGRLAQLLIAPLLPPLAVACAYGPGVDPAHEVAAATPMYGLRLVLLRTIAVASATFLAGVVTAVFAPWSWTSVAWVLPALGLAATTLALRAAAGSALRAALLVDAVWTVGMLLAQDRHQPGIEGLGPATQVGFGLLAIAAAMLIALRPGTVIDGGAR